MESGLSESKSNINASSISAAKDIPSIESNLTGSFDLRTVHIMIIIAYQFDIRFTGLILLLVLTSPTGRPLLLLMWQCSSNAGLFEYVLRSISLIQSLAWMPASCKLVHYCAIAPGSAIFCSIHWQSWPSLWILLSPRLGLAPLWTPQNGTNYFGNTDRRQETNCVEMDPNKYR